MTRCILLLSGGLDSTLAGKVLLELGVEVEDIRFPITIPKQSSVNLHLPKKYYVFAPFAAGNGPRSIPLSVAEEVLRSSPIPLALCDVQRYNIGMSTNTFNASGLDMLDVLVLLKNSAGVIGCDSGLPWLASAMGVPALVWGSHVSRLERTMTTKDMWWVETPAPCGPCGDFVGTMPQCRWKENVPQCYAPVSSEFVRYTLIEFDRMVG